VKLERDDDGDVVFMATKYSLDGRRPERSIIHRCKRGSSKLICNMVQMSSCESLGSILPGFGRLCNKCKANPSQQL